MQSKKTVQAETTVSINGAEDLEFRDMSLSLESIEWLCHLEHISGSCSASIPPSVKQEK